MLTNYYRYMKHNKRFILFFLLLITPFSVFSQKGEMLKKGDSLHLEYRFNEALATYMSLLDETKDSLKRLVIEEKIIQCENGNSLLKFAVTPSVIKNQLFSKEEFYLYFSSLRDSSWMKIPNSFVKGKAQKYYNAIFFPEGSKKILFSAPDNSGAWNIYETELIAEDLWSVPQLLNEKITSAGDEILPILSPSGKELYFASNGHFGMGGFDLFVSHWDDASEDWGMPENLGFPYSSVNDDLLFLNTKDGLHTMIATDRYSPQDSISIVVMDYIGTPVKKEITIDEAQVIAKLLPPPPKVVKVKAKPVQIRETKEDAAETAYSTLVNKMRVIQVELRKNLEQQKENRALYEKVENEEDKAFLKELITESEEKTIKLRKDLQQVSVKVQEVEMEFLAKGIIPKIEEEQEESDTEEEIDATPNYVFIKNHLADLREVKIVQPIPQFDYSFKILQEAQFAEDNTLPKTLVYQIQLFVLGNKATVASLKGLSPIYEKRQSSGKYSYTVGLFYTHTEALSCLNKVRKAGFPKAFVVAFNNGKPLSLKEAKVLEKKIPQNSTSYQLIIRNYPDGLPNPVISAIRETCDKDIANTVRDGSVIYIVGPFSEKTNVDYLYKILTGLGLEGVSVESVKF